jgi:cysteine-rich repeat protein
VTHARARRRAVHCPAAWILGGILLFAVLKPSPAAAHLSPPDLAFYGPFTAGSVRCLRVISMATQRCFKRVLALRRACMDDTLAGRTCDTAQREAQIAAAKQTVHATVAATCRGGQLTELSFSSLEEAQTDAVDACAYQAEAVGSLAYGPAGSPAGADTAAAAACMADTAAVSQRLLDVGVQWRSRAFDRMATQLIQPSKKKAIMARVDATVAGAVAVLAARLVQRCPTFATLYGQNAAAFLSKIRTRGNCLVSGAYVQSYVACPLPVCGNGAKEPPEQCDDGNTRSGDGCSRTCTFEVP